MEEKRRKNPGRTAKGIIKSIPDTFENVLKAVVQQTSAGRAARLAHDEKRV